MELEKQVVARLAKKFPAFYKTQESIKMANPKLSKLLYW
jgi:hypothetical protein